MSDDTAWQWRDSNSGAGSIQRILVTAEGRYQEAYRVYMDHLMDCLECPPDPTDVRCETGVRLQQAWVDARGACQGLPHP